MSDDAYVRRFGFRSFEGVRLGRLYRVFTLAWFNLREGIRRSGFTKMLLIFMFFSLLVQDIVAIIIGSILPVHLLGMTVNELFRITYSDSILGMISLVNRITAVEAGSLIFLQLFSGANSFMFLLLLAIVGGGMIADDQLNRTTEAYFSRISRFEYVLGKLLGLVMFSAIIIILPTLIQYFLLSQGLGTDFIANLDLLAWGIVVTIISSVVLSILALTFSSLTSRRSLATLSLFISAIMMSALPTALGAMSQAESLLILLDFVGCLSLLGAMMLGRHSVDINGQLFVFNNGIGLEGPMVLVMVGLMIAVGVLVLFFKVYRRDS